MARAVVARASPLHGKGPAKVLHRPRWIEKTFPWPGNPKTFSKNEFFCFELLALYESL